MQGLRRQRFFLAAGPPPRRSPQAQQQHPEVEKAAGTLRAARRRGAAAWSLRMAAVTSAVALVLSGPAGQCPLWNRTMHGSVASGWSATVRRRTGRVAAGAAASRSGRSRRHRRRGPRPASLCRSAGLLRSLRHRRELTPARNRMTQVASSNSRRRDSITCRQRSARRQGVRRRRVVGGVLRSRVVINWSQVAAVVRNLRRRTMPT